MDLTTITVAQFKSRFYRDFFYANQNPNQQQPTPPEGIDLVQDLDIENAFSDAMGLINQGLFSAQPGCIGSGSGSGTQNLTNAFLFLSAHCLSLNIKAADAGVNSDGAGAFPLQAMSGGSVSESRIIPDAYKDDPILAQYAQTAYGQKYLAMVLPFLRGNAQAVWGGALP